MSHWHLTTLKVAIVAPLLGAPNGSALTVWAQKATNTATLTSQRKITEQTLDAQRQLASDARLWDKRAELYVPLIAKLQQRNVLLSPMFLKLEPALAL